MFKYQIGKTYETQCGRFVIVYARTGHKDYECLLCSDGRCRYDRSAHSEDAGRVTGTAHDYSYPHNFKR